MPSPTPMMMRRRRNGGRPPQFTTTAITAIALITAAVVALSSASISGVDESPPRRPSPPSAPSIDVAAANDAEEDVLWSYQPLASDDNSDNNRNNSSSSALNAAAASSSPSTTMALALQTTTTESTEACVEHYDYYEPTEKWLLGVVALPFILCGLLSNGMSVAIFSHRQMRQQSVNWYLLVLGSSDFVILLGAFSILTLPRLSEILHWWSVTAISYYITPTMYSLMTMAQTTSVWMTVAMSLHRCIGVCFPYQSHSILSKRNVRSVICGVVIAAVLFNFRRFFEVSFQVCWMVPINVELPVLRMTKLRQNELYRKVFYEWAYTLIMFVIPFTVLIVVNSLVIFAIHKSREIHAKLNVRDDGARKQELVKEISTSIMLVAIVMAFLLCNTLTFVVNLMEKLDLQDLYVLLVPWSNMLVLCNASINICIYCIFSERYRALLFHYLRCCRRKGDRNYNTTSMSFL